MERLCLDCGHLIRGRSDKKFCNDTCRNSHNNKVKSDDNAVLKKINTILKKNRSILAHFNPMGKAKISRKKLAAAGFNFDYHTYTFSSQNGSAYIFCYEYGYVISANDDFLLVKREEDMWLS
jgi:hypothetical protein